ncbi:MAG: zinc ribbon domain-containing protein [Lachnospiraceae bacterium]|nr:zinc ribbon domain-containing protein [Lachnospiraceae bacterium]
MFCTNCGKKIEYNAVFCTQCGMKIVGTTGDTVVEEFKRRDMQDKKKVYLKYGIIIAIIMVLILFISDLANDDYYIELVKTGYPKAYPAKTYGEEFGDFFSGGEWSYFESSEGEDIVEFTGKCTYGGEEVEALVQFTVDEEEETFEVTYLSLNDMSQSELIILALFYAIFED